MLKQPSARARSVLLALHALMALAALTVTTLAVSNGKYLLAALFGFTTIAIGWRLAGEARKH
ncbi:hypothetical protein [Streptomyces goshikiensis]|uniref:hypothetical protein n=1 Tax=Streptomyces goshikiensis TaxID=1942 RepID=UPI002E11B951|nr:hypothetical protein OG224_39390 [Streptomyces goshikiensis]